MPEVLVATWENGVFAVGEAGSEHELAGRSVQHLAVDGRGAMLAVVDGQSLQRRGSDGSWMPIASAGNNLLRCCVASQGDLYVGTDDARVFRVSESEPPGASGLVELQGFQSVPGRDTWRAGQALVNGKLVGPPLGVRSLSATLEGALLVNVHVGGIPRSTDGGATWQPTIEVEADVHEVRAHPRRANIVAAAAAAGLCLSSDGGATWRVERDGLHDAYCSAVAFLGDDVLVAASEGHFASRGRIYRRPLDGSAALQPLIDGAAGWTDGIVDTHCIAVKGQRIAFADRGGKLHLSRDGGRSWSSSAYGSASPSSVHFL
jgi:hypothetical protein